MSEYIKLLKDSFTIAYEAARAQHVIKDFIPQKPKGRLIVIGAGKASADMAAAFEQHYHGALEGIIVTRYGHSKPTKYIDILEAAHPIPDKAGVRAVEKITSLLQSATDKDHIICLISGGGSALLSAPIDGINFEELQSLNKELLKSGAPIQDINVIRKHVNKALGGKLASYAPNAPFDTLAISDVTGDDPSIIASGATVPDPSTLSDAITIIKKHNINAPSAVIDALKNPKNETPKPNNPIFKNNSYKLIATPMKSLNAAQSFFESEGLNVELLDSEMQGDTNECAAKHTEIICSIYNGTSKIAAPKDKPLILISGGETTVKIKGDGLGGPNTQFMLQAALLLDKHNLPVYGIACDTDGTDGTGDNAGAFITPETIRSAQKQNLDAEEYLNNNDAYHFFKSIDALIKTGPTYTNVNDYRAFILLPQS